MRRVAIIVLAYAAGIAGTAACLVRARWTPAISTALAQSSQHRMYLAAAFDPDPAPVDVVWLGDSTVMGSRTRLGYARLLNNRVLAPMGRRTEILASLGLDAIGYYGLMDRVLARHPKLVVLVANLRMFGPGGEAEGAPFHDLLAWVPRDEIPRLAMLPYNVRGATICSLMLHRLVRSPEAFDALAFVEGLRLDAASSPWWDALGPPMTAAGIGRVFTLLNARHQAEYTRRLSADQPMVRFLGAAVGMATRHRVAVLVVVSPVPVGALTRRGVYDAATVARSVAALRQAVESNGGTLLDVSTALADADFYDEVGHFSTTGVERMVELVRGPIVAHLVEPSGGAVRRDALP